MRAHLLALGARSLRLPVAELDDRERLDEQRLPAVGDVVDDPRHVAPGACLDREHGAAAALRDELFLQVLAQATRAGEPLQLVGHA